MITTGDLGYDFFKMFRRVFLFGLVLLGVLVLGFLWLRLSGDEKFLWPFVENTSVVYNGGRVSFLDVEGREVYPVFEGRVSMGGGTSKGESFNMLLLEGEDKSCRYLFRGETFRPQREMAGVDEALFAVGSEVFEDSGAGLILDCRDGEERVIELTEKSFQAR